MKLYDPLARRRPAFDGEGKLFGHEKFRPLFCLFAGTDKHFPFGKIVPFQQQNLYTSPVFRVRKQARGENFCIVDDKHVARLQVLFDVAEDPVLALSRGAVVHQQAGRVARLCGSLRDEFFGQVVIIIGFQ